MYKVKYQYEDEKKPHNRFYSALDSSTAKVMFEATCSEGTLSGCNVKLIDVCMFEANASESSHAKCCAEDTKCEH